MPGVMPSSSWTQAHNPVAGVKMNTQMREIVAEGRMYGRKNANR